jgi:hypothetical protein
MPTTEPHWLFDTPLFEEGEPPTHIVKQVEAVIKRLTILAQECQAASGQHVLEEAPDVFAGPCNDQAAMALTYEAAATWLWGQLWGGPDRDALIDVMAN